VLPGQVAIGGLASGGRFDEALPLPGSDVGLGGDWYQITLADDEVIRIVAEAPEAFAALGGELRSNLIVVDASGRVVDGIAGVFDLTELVFTAPEAGMYYIRQTASSGAGVYQLSVESISPGSGPRVTGVFVGSSAWSDAFRTANDPATGLGIPVFGDQQRLISQANVNQIIVTFDEDVSGSIDTLDLRVVGADNSYSVIDVTWDPGTFAATWLLDRPITADRLRMALDATSISAADGQSLDGEWIDGQNGPSGDGVAGGNFEYRLDVLPGDANRSGSVDIFDAFGIRSRLFTNLATGGAYALEYDLDGNGMIDIFDAFAIRSRLFTSLPTEEPPTDLFDSDTFS
ncbi:MAG: hypothetical protein AAF743_12670, partial [Planctomycetota bacterium]